MRFTIEIPEPCLVVLVGATGSGKSTFAARHFQAAEILASDAFRAQFGRGESDQAASGRAFRALHAALDDRLARHLTTVVDATDVWPEARRALVRRSDGAGLPAVAIVLALDLAECLAGDASRPDRHVPRAIAERQWATLRDALERPGPPLAGEGFAAVHRFGSRREIDAVAIQRAPADDR